MAISNEEEWKAIYDDGEQAVLFNPDGGDEAWVQIETPGGTPGKPLPERTHGYEELRELVYEEFGLTPTVVKGIEVGLPVRTTNPTEARESLYQQLLLAEDIEREEMASDLRALAWEIKRAWQPLFPEVAAVVEAVIQLAWDLYRSTNAGDDLWGQLTRNK